MYTTKPSSKAYEKSKDCERWFAYPLNQALFLYVLWKSADNGASNFFQTVLGFAGLQWTSVEANRIFSFLRMF